MARSYFNSLHLNCSTRTTVSIYSEDQTASQTRVRSRSRTGPTELFYKTVQLIICIAYPTDYVNINNNYLSSPCGYAFLSRVRVSWLCIPTLSHSRGCTNTETFRLWNGGAFGRLDDQPLVYPFKP